MTRRSDTEFRSVIPQSDIHADAMRRLQRNPAVRQEEANMNADAARVAELENALRPFVAGMTREADCFKSIVTTKAGQAARRALLPDKPRPVCGRSNGSGLTRGAQ